jgi:hypothetical protein
MDDPKVDELLNEQGAVGELAEAHLYRVTEGWELPGDELR